MYSKHIRKNRSTSYNFETTFLILLGIHYVVLKEHFIIIDMYIQLQVTCCVICAQECKDVRKRCLLGQLVSRYSTKTNWFFMITNENQQNAQMIFIFSICSTYMFRSCLTIFRVRCYRVSNTKMCAFVQGLIVYKYILHNPYIVC